jgi:hypothetical protein
MQMEDQEEAPDALSSFVGGLTGMVNVLRHIDADTDVQKERQRANIAHRKYRACEVSISRARKRYIDDALASFRAKRRDEYDDQANKYKRVLRTLRATEIKSAQRFIGGRSDVSIQDAEELYRQIEDSTSLRTRADNDGTFGPLKSRFWTHG